MRRLFLAGGLGLLLCGGGGTEALAQSDPVGDRLIVDLEGYTAAGGAFDGPLDGSGLAELGGVNGDDADDLREEFDEGGYHGYFRTFGAPDGSVVGILAIGPVDAQFAGEFGLGFIDGLTQAGEEIPGPLLDDRVVGRSARVQQGGLTQDVHTAAFVGDDDLVIVVFATGPSAEAGLVSAVNRQFLLTPPTAIDLGDAVGDAQARSDAYEFGRQWGLITLVLILGLGTWGVITFRRGKQRRLAPVGGPLPPPMPPPPWTSAPGMPAPPGPWAPAPPAPPMPDAMWAPPPTNPPPPPDGPAPIE